MIDPDYLTNKSNISPSKQQILVSHQGSAGQAISASYATSKPSSSKFSLVNRGAAVGQFPAVVNVVNANAASTNNGGVSQPSSTTTNAANHTTTGVLSPKSNGTNSGGFQ